MDGEESIELGRNFDLQIGIVILLNSWFYHTSQETGHVQRTLVYFRTWTHGFWNL